jgi:RNA polymerase sigma-70 factor (ECF subfamily)
MLETINRDEDQLIKKAISGDKEAFGHLYDCYFLQIYKYLLIRTDTREDAEDMTETVFMKAWKHLPHFGGKKKKHNFRAWIFRIAHNTLIDHFRTKKVNISLESVSQNRSADAEPESVVVQNEEVKRIHKVITMLDDVSQQVIISRFFGGLSHKETAQSVGVNENNVRIIQYRALRKLNDLLSEKNE